MGCLNDTVGFKHWFGNIHLSGPCNRKCYFCIGQHMMALDKFNVLDTWPLDGLDAFLKECNDLNVTEINLTGTNTDPLLYKHLGELRHYFKDYTLGIRTNAVLSNLEGLKYFDKGSITICSLDKEIYKKMMGHGEPPRLNDILDATQMWSDVKVNIVLGPENCGPDNDIIKTIIDLKNAEYSNNQFTKINLREPYGQPHVGNPLMRLDWLKPACYTYGMPTYNIGGIMVTYWDVHYVEVESINLYANGNISMTYPITKGYDDTGIVLDQTHFTGGRVREQWLNQNIN
jgi:hypothetical protein